MAQLVPQLQNASCMNMDVSEGAIREGLISFIYVVFLLWSKKKYANNFFLRVLIMGICEISLVLLTGGCMNPAYVSPSPLNLSPLLVVTQFPNIDLV